MGIRGETKSGGRPLGNPYEKRHSKLSDALVRMDLCNRTENHGIIAQKIGDNQYPQVHKLAQ